ncbi:MAG TPA: hypothetical protein VFT22_40390 [Kofleriaceae bacterium]|nr:hypothetical protein [Kofleriaceae bacterium]
MECESCRELVVAGFAIEGGPAGHTVRATCPVCRHVMTATADGAEDTREAVARGPVDLREVPGSAEPVCPKCGAVRRDDAGACAACGLAVDRMAAYADARDAAVPEPVREAWARASAAWTDEVRHDELLGLIASHNAYAWAAGRYRTRAGDPIAQRQLERLRRAAEATLLASAAARPAAETRPYRGAAGVLAVLIVVIIVGLLYAVVLRDHNVPRGGAPAVPAGSSGAVRPLAPGHPVSPSTIK